MQNGKEPDTATIYLADGEQAQANVNGRSREGGLGRVMIHRREIKVGPLPGTWSALGYGEIVALTLQTGEVIHAVLAPEDYRRHVAYLSRDESIDATICLFDEGSGAWREMTEQEYEQERRAWEADAKDQMQIRREWREYRDEGLGERG